MIYVEIVLEERTEEDAAKMRQTGAVPVTCKACHLRLWPTVQSDM